MRKLAGAFLVATVAWLGACAPKTFAVAPVVVAPKFPEFVMPTVPAALAGLPAADHENRAWRFLQAGDLKSAETEIVAALRVSPDFYPAEAAFGYVELAGQSPADALPHFERAVEADHAYVPALIGRGQALEALGREREAAAAFQAAVDADPSLTDVQRRVEVLRFRALEQDLARARQTARAGKLDEATAAYAGAIAASPDSAFLYRELGAIERQKGEADAALDHFRKAIALEPTDAKSLDQIGELLEARSDFTGAASAYEQSLAIEANDEIAAKAESARNRAEIARLPPEYRAIGQSPQITRADLAALIGVHLGPLLPAAGRAAVLITDVRSNWASAWIIAVARAGVLEPYANHQFQPRAIVRRGDLARAVSRLLARVAAGEPGRAHAWMAARERFTDLAPSHLAYPAASMAVAAGVMRIDPDRSFHPLRPVSGAEAIEVIARVEALVSPVLVPPAASRK